MQRYKITVEYYGNFFHGFTKQLPSIPTVQLTLENALNKFVGYQNYNRIVCSSRTDTGVHALGNVFHVDIQRRHRKTGSLLEPYTSLTVHQAINAFLKKENVYIRHVEAMNSNFHARFDATGREYIYQIVVPSLKTQTTHNIDRNASFLFSKDLTWSIKHRLDINAMIQASQYMIGHHDFSSFRSSGCQAQSPFKSIDLVDIQCSPFSSLGLLGKTIYENRDLIQIRIVGRSFLYNMVRNMVGSLYSVGKNQLQPNEIQEILQLKDRRRAPQKAPAHGLYLTKVFYGKEYEKQFLEDLY